ncbi:MAG: hypothetical protein KAJ24_04155, partial [Candidatus Aenigmarchaeota archaeon]|nr:hypothetical protein [Candidatus Aenigmarchaeota archaeon]
RTAGHLFGFVFKNSEKKAILLSFCILIFFSYVHFYSLISRFELNGFTIARNQDGMIAYALFFVLVSCPLLKLTVKRAKNITPALNYIALALVSISLFNIAAYEINHFMAFGEKSNENKVLFNESLEVPEVAPDIYYIILDRYAPSRTLKEYYGYDNSKFIEYLTDKGFYIANESLANYPKTHLSLASSLNMKHLLYLSEMLGENSKDTNIANNMMKDHKVWGLLKEKNYTFIHFGTWWEPTRKNEYADININYYALEMNEFHKELLKTTAIYPFINKILFKKEQWTRELYKFDQLEEMPEIEEPKFVFAHFLVTHDPYSFTREGDLLENTGQNEKELYIEQVIFLEKKLRFLTDALISKSERPVIIILQSDEGPFTPEFGEHGGAGIDWTTLSDESLQVHMRIFNAI